VNEITDLRQLALSALRELTESQPDSERIGRHAELVRIAVEAHTKTLPKHARLFQDPRFSFPGTASGPAVTRLQAAFRDTRPEAIGHLYETLLSEGLGRKQSGSFYTPRAITERVVSRALAGLDRPPHSLRVCDPASGGAAFLLEVGRQLVARGADRRQVAEECLFGVDVSPLAVAVGEVALLSWAPEADLARVSEHLCEGDAVGDFDWQEREFDLVIGNPPWVAYAGRAAQPLPPEKRRRYVAGYRSFRGYPTLHGLFVERATRLAPNGVIALVLPSPVADLAGYSAVRRVLTERHTPDEPLMELGQDAFSGVTQPAFALVATPGRDPRAGEREWLLVERQKARVAAAEVAVPEALGKLASLPRFPKELFGEMGFQSAGDVAKTLFLRDEHSDGVHSVPLLEGRDVNEFRQGPPRLFLNPDKHALARARTRLRDPAEYRRVRFVTRQTAKFPISALHSGLPFRNTLLAGFDVEGLSPELVVALLNSCLYRALHIGFRRDARQAAFPQVKIAHLRALPRPPEDPLRRARLSAITCEWRDELRCELDQLVFELFGLSPEERGEVSAFVRDLTRSRSQSATR
jgi:hypothetical protein